MKIKIVADSSINISEIKDVSFETVPLKIIAGDKEYIDTPELDVAKMMDELDAYNGKSGTSCPNQSDWLKAFEGADIVYAVTISSNLSGSYAAAVLAKQEYEEKNPQAKVYIFDSLATGPKMQLMVDVIRNNVVAGKSFDETVEATLNYAKNSKLFFALESLKNLANNGRISPMAAALAGVVGIRVIGKASDEGTIEAVTKARGEKKTIIGLVDEMKKQGFKGGRVCISECLNENLANLVKERITTEFEKCQVDIVKCGGLCSFYAQRGGIIVGFETIQSHADL